MAVTVVLERYGSANTGTPTMVDVYSDATTFSVDDIGSLIVEKREGMGTSRLGVYPAKFWQAAFVDQSMTNKNAKSG